MMTMVSMMKNTIKKDVEGDVGDDDSGIYTGQHPLLNGTGLSYNQTQLKEEAARLVKLRKKTLLLR